MTIQEIENMTFAELKARQSELIEAMKDTLPTELAARYVQARLDAKQRDEKLSEQGQTITNLNEALQTRAEQLALADRALADERGAVVKLKDQREQLAQDLQAALQTNGQMAERCERLKLQANRFTEVLTTLVQQGTNALGLILTEAADAGG